MTSKSSSRPYWTEYAVTAPVTLMEGITIRELINPTKSGNEKQSLAEATFQPGATLFYHYQKKSEKIYHVSEGEGIVKRGNELIKVKKGDSVCIPPGVPHNATNTSGKEEMKILCFLAPPFTEEDVVVISEEC